MLELINVLVGDLAGSLTDSNAKEAMAMVKSVVKTITTIIYIVLGLFLVVKGALIGMQIVKAADEPQVRQEKISSLKWLVIGVAVAYAVTIAADLLTDYFADTFNTFGE